MKNSAVRKAFTLVELLVVMGVIAVLAGILIPVVNTVRIKGRVADTRQFINQLQAAIESYHQDYRAYPGPLTNDSIYNTNTTEPQGIDPLKASAPGFDSAVATKKFTMSENLVLGLLGGLRKDPSDPTKIVYDGSTVGQGPMDLGPGVPTRHQPYIDPSANVFWRTDSAGLKTGKYTDEGGTADDTCIPEFVDRFSSPMPILYLRAKVGVPIISLNDPNYRDNYNSVITPNDVAAPRFRAGQYDISQIQPYTGSKIGEGKKLPNYVNFSDTPPHGLNSSTRVTASIDRSSPNYVYPYNAFPYFQSPNNSTSPRQKDGFILISAGPDRVYGTSDDICSFGDITP